DREGLVAGGGAPFAVDIELGAEFGGGGDVHGMLLIQRLPHALGNAGDGRQGDVFEIVRCGQRNVGGGDADDGSVEIVEGLVGGDRGDLGAPAAQARILLDREQAPGLGDRAQYGLGV